MPRALWRDLVEDAIRHVGGPVGVRLRRAYYSRRLRSCGSRLVIEPGVHILAPEWISVGDDVWIDRQVVLIAGPSAHSPERVRRIGFDDSPAPGEIVIGDRAHVGIGSIIQGHGGVRIGRAFTSSPHSKIYSLSNDHRRCREGTHPAAAEDLYFVESPVSIGDNVWIGMNAVVIGRRIGDDSFVKPGAVVSADVAANSVVEGAPGVRTGSRFTSSESAATTPASHHKRGSK